MESCLKGTPGSCLPGFRTSACAWMISASKLSCTRRQRKPMSWLSMQIMTTVWRMKMKRKMRHGQAASKWL